MNFFVLVAALSVGLPGRRQAGTHGPLCNFRAPALTTPRYLRTDMAWYGDRHREANGDVHVSCSRPILARLSLRADREHDRPLTVRCEVGDRPRRVRLHQLRRAPLASIATSCSGNVHKVHHSSLHTFDGFATTRTHMIENMLRFVPGQAVLFLVGHARNRPFAPAVADRRPLRRFPTTATSASTCDGSKRSSFTPASAPTPPRPIDHPETTSASC